MCTGLVAAKRPSNSRYIQNHRAVLLRPAWQTPRCSSRRGVFMYDCPTSGAGPQVGFATVCRAAAVCASLHLAARVARRETRRDQSRNVSLFALRVFYPLPRLRWLPFWCVLPILIRGTKKAVCKYSQHRGPPSGPCCYVLCKLTNRA